MKNPYATQIESPKIQPWWIADTRVKGFPMMLTEKSLHTKLNNIMFIGVQIWKKTFCIISFSLFSSRWKNRKSQFRGNWIFIRRFGCNQQVSLSFKLCHAAPQLTWMSLHIRVITNRLKQKPKNPIRESVTAANVYPQTGNPSGGVSVISKGSIPLCTKLKFVTDTSFIIVTENPDLISNFVVQDFLTDRINVNSLSTPLF